MELRRVSEDRCPQRSPQEGPLGSDRRQAMNAMSTNVTRYDVAAYVIMASLIVGALSLHLIPAVLSGFLVFEIVHTLAPRIVSPTWWK